MNYKEEKDKEIVDLIEKIFNENNKKYGYIRITQELKNRGVIINKKKVARIMRDRNLSANKTVLFLQRTSWKNRSKHIRTKL